ncbi:energy transducer TonB [Polaribacter sp. MSW13]|uniref:Energy transducer TonB n=1 Tax=Polaribacter marinus TaxID=2916838 RepID=A0A9X2AMY8_9FLAO|nr:energy transducer TonB [Polaribacter marinus]MCI2229364.1 energy transducer TonB [Polaribacter marinus]
MKDLKKLPTKQLEKFSNIFMQLGLVLVLFIVYLTLEHQTEEKTFALKEPVVSERIYMEPDEVIVFVKEPKVEPKIELPKQNPFILDQVKKGDNDIVEISVIDEPIEDPKIIDIDAVIEIVEKPIIEEDVPFVNIEDAPVFKGCEGLSREENKICFDKKMKQFVQRNFDAELGNELGLNTGIYKIQTQFIIDKEGNVIDVKIRAPHVRLKKETQNLIEKLPKFTPGKQRAIPVKVRYTLPISFRVD